MRTLQSCFALSGVLSLKFSLFDKIITPLHEDDIYIHMTRKNTLAAPPIQTHRPHLTKRNVLTHELQTHLFAGLTVSGGALHREYTRCPWLSTQHIWPAEFTLI